MGFNMYPFNTDSHGCHSCLCADKHKRPKHLIHPEFGIIKHQWKVGPKYNRFIEKEKKMVYTMGPKSDNSSET